MRVLFLTHYYPPEVGAPQARIRALARGLASRGHDVTVHTGFPHYPDGLVLAPYRNRPLLIERGEDGVRVLRTLVLPAANRGFARRLAGHATLAISSVGFAPAAGPQDVVVVESPPLFTAAAGAAYAGLKRAPLVMNVADRWPASAVALGVLRDRRAIAAAQALERWCYRRAHTITVPTAGIEDALRAVEPCAGKVRRVWPAVDLERFDPAPAKGDGPLRVVYAGTVGLSQGLSTLVEAASRAGPDVVQVGIAGGGADVEAVRERIERLSATNVRLLGVVPEAAVPALYAAADAGVILLRDREIFAGALPTKLFEVMAAGRPAVVSAHGEAATLVAAEGAGLAVEPESPVALADALATLHADRDRARRMGAAARDAAERRFGREAMVDRWEELLERARQGSSQARYEA
jgi:glycosyltransferase involved in cell wall biosynthesis